MESVQGGQDIVLKKDKEAREEPQTPHQVTDEAGIQPANSPRKNVQRRDGEVLYEVEGLALSMCAKEERREEDTLETHQT